MSIFLFRIVWNNQRIFFFLAIIFADCPVSLASSLPYINGPFSCILGDTCSDITCCLNVEPLSTYLTIRVNLEYCQDKITITVDKFQAEMKVSKIIASGNLWYFKYCSNFEEKNKMPRAATWKYWPYWYIVNDMILLNCRTRRNVEYWWHLPTKVSKRVSISHVVSYYITYSFYLVMHAFEY